MEVADPRDPYDDEDEEVDIMSPSKPSGAPAGSSQNIVEDDDDDEEDDDDDEEEDEDEEDERPRKKKRSRKRSALNRFVDVEAEVDDSDEDLDDDEEELPGGFLGDDDDIDDSNIVSAGHQRFARKADEAEEQDLEAIASEFKERYRSAAVKYSGDSSEIPQRLLMPGVQDATLWQVRVRPGKERDLVFQIMRKANTSIDTGVPLEIISAFERDSLPGMIYVEARSQQHVKDAINGLVGVFASRIILVPIAEMASLLRIRKKVTSITPGSWVRLKRGKYAGDLAQVLDLMENGEGAGLKFIPRIDLSPREDFGPNKRKKGAAPQGYRPPQRFFNAEDVGKVFKHKVALKPGHSRMFVFAGETYNNGFIEKDMKFSAMVTENVNPTLDEIAKFTAGDKEFNDGNENSVDLSMIAADARKAAASVLQPGDHVEVFEGEQNGMQGIVESINGEVVSIRARDVDIDGQRIEVPVATVRKKFKAGDHVKVLNGTNTDESGLVVSILNDTVTFLSDMSLQEVTVFAKDVREAAEVGAGTNTVGAYELHDLVQLDQQTVGVIYKTERDSFRVLDQSGQTRIVQPHQITMLKNSRSAFAVDSQGYEIRPHDNMKESEGEGRKGIVLHTHQSIYAFLHNRDVAENGGVFVTRARGLISVAPKGKANGLDLSKMNPAIHKMQGGMAGSGNKSQGRSRLIGLAVFVVQGQYKGYQGTIKDATDDTARVELHTQNKVISLEHSKLRRKTPQGQLVPLHESFQMANGMNGGMGPPRTPLHRGTPNPYGGGGMTPAGNRRLDGRTPNPYADGGRTPGWGADGGKTPGSNPWAASARTPNPYSATRTPNPYTDGGGRTPHAGGLGTRTPARPTGGATPNPYGARGDPRVRPGTTPGGAGASASWGDSNGEWGNAWGAPTPGPANAPTPAVFNGGDEWGAPPAATPYTSAPTPYASAPTPGVHAQTPGMFAQTPGAHYAQTPGLAAATPGFGAPTPGPGRWVDQSAARQPHWLSGCRNVVVEINPSKQTDVWHNGDYDGLQVLVLSVDDGLSREDGSVSANCYGLEQDLKSKRVTIPVEYLEAVRPQAGDKAMIITGDARHKVIKIIHISGDVVEFVEDVIPTSAAKDGYLPKESIVKYQEFIAG